jgi:hypothetical protein
LRFGWLNWCRNEPNRYSLSDLGPAQCADGEAPALVSAAVAAMVRAQAATQLEQRQI